MASRYSWAGRYGQRMRALVLAHYGTTCHLCGQPGADSADHLVPRSRGGDDSLANLRPAHRTCNAARQNRSVDAFRKRFPAAAAQPSRQW